MACAVARTGDSVLVCGADLVRAPVRPSAVHSGLTVPAGVVDSLVGAFLRVQVAFLLPMGRTHQMTRFKQCDRQHCCANKGTSFRASITTYRPPATSASAMEMERVRHQHTH